MILLQPLPYASKKNAECVFKQNFPLKNLQHWKIYWCRSGKKTILLDTQKILEAEQSSSNLWKFQKSEKFQAFWDVAKCEMFQVGTIYSMKIQWTERLIFMRTLIFVTVTVIVLQKGNNITLKFIRKVREGKQRSLLCKTNKHFF